MESRTQHQKQNFIIFEFCDSNEKNSYTYTVNHKNNIISSNPYQVNCFKFTFFIAIWKICKSLHIILHVMVHFPFHDFLTFPLKQLILVLLKKKWSKNLCLTYKTFSVLEGNKKVHLITFLIYHLDYTLSDSKSKFFKVSKLFKPRRQLKVASHHHLATQELTMMTMRR